VRGEEVGLSREYVACDVLDFEDYLDSDQEEKALEIYQGPLMSGFHLNDMLEFEQWLESERALLNDRAAHAAWLLADSAADAGIAHEAIQWAQRSMDLSRDEAAVRHLISMRDRFGDRAGAIREYDRFARKLTRDLEADPSPETQELIAHIRARSGSNTPSVAMQAVVVPRLDSPQQNSITAAPAAPPSAPLEKEPVKRDIEPSAAREERRAARRRLAFLLVSLPIVALAAWLTIREINARQVAIIPGSVAILPFSYTGSREHADAAEAVVNLLDANIENIGGVHTLDWRSLKSLVNKDNGGDPLTLATAAAIARRFKVQWYIVGSVAEAGDRLRVTAAVYDRSSSDAAGLRTMAEGNPNDLFFIVDELTAKVIAAGASGPNARLYRSAVLTTSSVPALKAYLYGERAYREARYISALQSFRQAVEADTAFALAYFRLSQSADLTGETALAMWAADQALEQSRGLGRFERQHAEAWRLALLGKIPHAEKLYRDLIAQDPTDIEALQQLAWIHYNWGPRYGRPPSESAREWQRVLDLDPYNPVAIVYLARIRSRESNRMEFDRLAARFEKFGPETDRALELNALKAFVFDDTAARVPVIRDLTTADATVRNRVIVSVLTSATDLRESAALAARYLGSQTNGDEVNDTDVLLKPSVSLARGRIREALAIIANAGARSGLATLERGAIAFVHDHAMTPEEMQSVRDTLMNPDFSLRRDRTFATMPDYIAGLLDIRLGDAMAATRQASRLESRASLLNGPKLASLIRAELARNAGDHERALTILGTPDGGGQRVPRGFAFPLAHERFLRAELLREQGRAGEALRWYATFPDPAGYDLIFLGLALQRRADCYRMLGNGEAARSFYARAAMLWKDADTALRTQQGGTVQVVTALSPK